MPVSLHSALLATVFSCAALSGGSERTRQDASLPGAVRSGAPAPAVRAAPESNTFADLAVAALAEARPSVSADRWMSAHPGDRLTAADSSIGGRGGDWCLVASHDSNTSDGLHAIIYAFFYVPAAPADLYLPADADTAGLARRSCMLGAVWIEASSPDTAKLQSAAEAVHAALSNAYGPLKLTRQAAPLASTASHEDTMENLLHAKAGVWFPGSASWSVHGRWESDSLTIVSARDMVGVNSGGNRVLAFAYEPRAKLDLGAGDTPEVPDSAGPTPRDLWLRDVGPIAGLTSDSARLLSALSERPGGDSLLQKAMVAWTARGAAGPPAQRAAALLVADNLVPGGLAAGDSAVVKRYAAMGLEFNVDQLGGGDWVYARTLLVRAAQLAPESPAGRWARLQIMRSGFNLTGLCGGGNAPYRRVVDDGVKFLATERNQATRAEVEWLVADGYADVVALANGAGDEYADRAPFIGQAPDARRNAIAHFRAALSLDHTSAAANLAWPKAWRLIAGLPIYTTRFFCVYD